MVKRLAKHGIECQYTLISMVSFIINTVTKVFLSSSYILQNGALVAPMGTSIIGCIAQKNQIPVVVVCETYKFEERVNLDQINNNEQGATDEFKENYLRKQCPNNTCLEEIIQQQSGQKAKKDVSEVQFLNLKLDLTPQKYLSMIVCEIGNIPPHSVPVVIREIMAEQEDHRGLDSSEESISEDEESLENSSNQFQE